MKAPENATDAARKIGHVVPLFHFGMTRWETGDGFAFVVASSAGDGSLNVQVGHRVDLNEATIGRFTILADGEIKASWKGENLSPAAIFKQILSTIEIMGAPVVTDSLSEDEEEGELME